LDGDLAIVGITPHAQESLGEIQYVDLPKAGKRLSAGDSLAVVESSKAASDVPAPVAGVVAAVNPRLVREPALINRDPLGEGWLAKLSGVAPAALEALLDETAYRKLVGSR
jgi:glycine cleavage system H protein